MRTSLEGLADIAGHEGIVTSRYRDCVGVWTIGIGHTAAAGPPDPEHLSAPIPLDDLVALFHRDIARYEVEVTAALQRPVSQAQFDALVSFHFNTGAIARAGLTHAINKGQFERAAALFLAWRRPPAILPRRRLEQRLFAQGIYGHGGSARVYTANAAGAVDWGRGRLCDLRPILARIGH